MISYPQIIKINFIAFTLIIFSSCVSQDEYDKLKNENSELKEELDEVKFGADRLLKQAKDFYANKQFDKALEKINLLIDKHNESPEAGEGRKLQLLINKEKEEIAELSVWNNIIDNDTTSINNYINHYPEGKYINQARMRYAQAIANLETTAYEYAVQQNTSFAWRAFLETYPNRLDIADINRKIIQLEIAEIQKNSDVSPIPSSYQTDYGYSENSSVIITNNTNYTLTVRYSGPTVTSISIPPNGTQTVYLQSGTYQVGATAGNASCAGTENLHGSYTSSYRIRTTTGYQSYYR